MKAKVDQDTCIGCELCVDECPEVFRMNDEGLSEPHLDPIPPELEACADQAAEACPVSAIELTP